MLEIAILILQDISNVMLGTTFLAMPLPDLFARKIVGCEGTSSGCDEHHYYHLMLLLLMRASDALKTNIFLSTIGENQVLLTQVSKGSSEGKNEQRIVTSKFVLRMFM